MAFNKSYLKSCLNQPIAFHRVFVDIAGSVTAAVMLSQAWYWSNRLEENRDGWFWKTRDEWTAETGLTRREQETARRALTDRGFMEEDLKGVPAKMFFRLNFERVHEAILIFSRLADSAIQVGTNPSNQLGGNVPTNTETTQRLLQMSAPEVPTRGKKRSLNDEEKKRFEPCRDVLRKYMTVVRDDVNAQATPQDYMVLAQLIKNDPTITADILLQCLRNRLGSDAINEAEPIKTFLMDVRRWELGSLDRYGKPKQYEVAR